MYFVLAYNPIMLTGKSYYVKICFSWVDIVTQNYIIKEGTELYLFFLATFSFIFNTIRHTLYI